MRAALAYYLIQTWTADRYRQDPLRAGGAAGVRKPPWAPR